MVDLAILIIIALCVLAGYYRGTIYAAINLGITIVSLLLALLLIPAVAGIIQHSERVYKGMLYYFEGYEYVSTTSVEQVHAVAADVSEEEIRAIVDRADMPIPMGDAVRKNIRRLAYADKGIVTLGDYFNQTIVDVVINILSMFGLFVVIRFVVGWALRIIDFSLEGFPVMNRYDAAFSCGIGFLHGVLLVYALFLLVPVALTVVPRLESFLDESLLGGFFYHVNPLLQVIPTT
ncbi:MAG: CvpA family protein [Clostridia bacterium]|nr:CvpA family protein [Clostridia bacterium]